MSQRILGGVYLIKAGKVNVTPTIMRTTRVAESRPINKSIEELVMKRKLLFLHGILLAAAVSLVAQVPQPGAPRPGAAPAPNARAGNSVLMEANGPLVQRRRFEAGNRTYWHTHEKGFLILVEEGRARVQKKSEAMKELRAGDTDYTPPNVVHWHGAAPGEGFVQIGVSFGGNIMFLDPV